MISYLLKAILDLIYIALDYDTERSYTGELVYLFQPNELIPVSYVLYIHAKAY